MPHVGVPELIVILMILVLVFGASRLPQIGEGMGKAIRNFKRGMASDDRIDVVSPGDAPAAKTPRSGDAASESTNADVIEKR